MRNLRILALLTVAWASAGCMTLFARATGKSGGERFRVLNATSLSICQVLLTTNLNPEGGSNALVEWMHGVAPGEEGHVDVPVYGGETPSSHGVKAYACGNSGGTGPLIAQVDNIDVSSTSPIVLK